MTTARIDHVATLLNDGAVLIAGGTDAEGDPLFVAEIFDPTTDRFRGLTTGLTEPRVQAAAVRLQDGDVLIAGGGTTDLTSAEVYDPVAQTFAATVHPMNAGRFNPAMTLLGNGNVLVTGGRNGLNDLASSEIYNPQQGQFVPGPNMASPRLRGFSILLPRGQVLVGGGYPSFLQTPRASAELYYPVRGTFRPTSQPLRIGRSASPATNAVLLNDGRVMVVGGQDLEGMPGGMPLASGEIYDPTTTFSPLPAAQHPPEWSIPQKCSPPTGELSSRAANTMSSPRRFHTATVIAGGTVLLAGGDKDSVNATETTDIHSAKTNSFSGGPSMNAIRDFHTATMLPSGRVLIAGGRGLSANQPYVWPTSELLVSPR
jgi:hypothetical protein